MKRKTLIFLSVVLVILAGWYVISWLIVTEEEKLALFIEEAAETMPEKSTDAVLRLVDIERFGLKLSHPGYSEAFKRGETNQFERIVSSRLRYVKNADVSVVRLDVEIRGSIADFSMTIKRTLSDEERRSPLSLLGVSGELAKIEQGWRFTKVHVEPSRRIIERLME